MAQTLVHIGLGPRMVQQIHGVEHRTTMEGFDFPGFFQKIVAEERVQRNKGQIIAFLREEGEKFASWVDGLSERFPECTHLTRQMQARMASMNEHAAERPA